MQDIPVVESNPKIDAIEYLRGIAALSVAWFHITLPLPPGIVHASGRWGWIGVPVFFVISGYVLPLSLWGRHSSHYGLGDFAAFCKRRIVRIEPPYLLSIVLVLLLWYVSALFPAFKGPPFELPVAQSLAHVAYLPKLFGYDWLQPVYWTLAYEFCFYISLGVLFGALVRWPLATLVLAGASFEILWWAWRGDINEYIPLFVMGAAVFLWRVQRIDARALTWIACVCLVASAADDWQVAAAAGATAAVILTAAGRRLPGNAHRVALFLGTISYSVYITHVPISTRIVNLGMRWGDSSGWLWVVTGLALLGTIAFAAAYWRWVERPFIDFSRR